ncbi:MAG TPA: acyltransferase family protein, partial [Thermoanaerobaculia bacterium]
MPLSLGRGTEDGADSRRRAGAQLGYVPAIDGLRALAIVMVLVYHLRPARLPSGLLGVDLFFVISGFVVTASLQRGQQEDLRPLLSRFYARRIRRILPALLAMLVCGTILTTLFIPWAWSMFPASSYVALLAAVGASNILLPALDGGYATRLLDYTPFFHTWSLGVEEQFYLLFPAFYWATMRSRRRLAPFHAFALLSAISFALAVALRESRPALAFYAMPARYWELGAGTLLCLSVERWLPPLRQAGAAGRTLPLLAALPLLLAAALQPRPPGWLPGEIAAVASAILLIVSACASPAAARLLTLSPVLLTGRSSYSLYLWHVPVFVLFKSTVGIDGIVLGSAAIAVTLGLGLLSYAFVEQPFRRLGVEGFRRQAAIFVGAAAALAATVGVILVFTAGPPPATLSTIWRDPRIFSLAQFRQCGNDGLASRLAGDMDVATGSCDRDGDKPRLFVAGDSHTAVYASLVLRLSADLRLNARLLAMLGCPFPPLERQGAARCASWYSR